MTSHDAAVIRALAVTVSNRAAAGVYEDRSGPVLAGLLVTIATGLSLVLPSSPGAGGVFEAAALVGLQAYGIEKADALSFAIVLHAVNFFPYVLAGLLVLLWRRPATR